MKYLLYLTIPLFIIGCGKDDPPCLYPELYGEWNFHRRNIHVNEEDVLDTLNVSDRYESMEIDKNGPSYIFKPMGRIDTVDISVDSFLITIDYTRDGGFLKFEIDSISQDYIEFHCDCEGRVGGIDTDVLITYILTK